MLPPLRYAVIAALATMAGCFTPEYAECDIQCGAGGACPDQLACAADGYCHAPGAPPSCAADAAILDAAESIDAEPPADAGVDGAPDAMPCTGTTACSVVGVGPATTACNDGPPTGTCVPPEWIYCQCGGGATQPTVFLDPPGGGVLVAVTVVGPSGIAPVSIAVDGVCPGSDSGCPLDGGACDGSDLRAYRWNNLSGFNWGPGNHTLTVYSSDGGAPCFTGDGGVVWFNLPFTR